MSYDPAGGPPGTGYAPYPHTAPPGTGPDPNAYAGYPPASYPPTSTPPAYHAAPPAHAGYAAYPPSAYPPASAPPAYLGAPASSSEELRTIYVSGFPQDVKERELNNLCRFLPGYEVGRGRLRASSGTAALHGLQSEGTNSSPGCPQTRRFHHMSCETVAHVAAHARCLSPHAGVPDELQQGPGARVRVVQHRFTGKSSVRPAPERQVSPLHTFSRQQSPELG
jgi:hypothetical protein